MYVFAHNGGKFDIWYLLPYLTPGTVKIIHGRIVSAMLGIHELRDSFAIMPFALDKYNKVKIDYEKFRSKVREQYKDEIMSYLRMDCVYLWELCDAFIREFGNKLTIGSASQKQLKTFHTFKCGNENFDGQFRKDFYFGGRNQVFESGILTGDWKVYDVNSMYPHVMRDYLHPVGTGVEVDKRINRRTCFVVAEGENYGAFPVRDPKTGGLDFTVPRGTFHTTIHEWNAAEDTGCFKPRRIIKTYGFTDRATFGEFVDHFYNKRQKAIHDNDGRGKLFYKYVLNSAYGKFAQNPDNYFDWQITSGKQRPTDWHDCGKECEPDCSRAWTPAYTHDSYVIWQRPTQMHHYYNVATGASITGAARSVLLRGIHAATRPIYCDTDSIICENLAGVTIDAELLGAWKLEANCSLAAICGKKLYALFTASENPTNETCVKKAHKGARLTGMEILRIARGSTLDTCNPVPAFHFDGTATFTKRRIRKTA
jgi:hypothetical protein